MNRFSFSTFQVDECNREALDVCRAIAGLDSTSPMPVLLLGDRGSGKTHLLYSIVNHVRSASEPTALACVTAREFPDKVLQIIRDPAPVHKARFAILLVDQLESFTDRLEELEALVRIFLEKGHYVLFASDVHPARLNRLSDGFRALLERGRILRMQPHVLTGASILPNPAMEDLVKRQQEQIRTLREELERVAASDEKAEALANLQRQLDEEKQRTSELARQLEDEQKARAELESRLAQSDAERDALRSELEEGRAALASASALQDETARLTRELEAAIAERDSERAAAERERNLLVADLARKAMIEEELNALKLQLQAARRQGDLAQNEARSVVESVQTVLEQVEAGRAKFEDMEQQYQVQIQDLERRLAEYATQAESGAEAVESGGAVESLRREYDAQRHELEAQLSAARAEVVAAIKARDGAIERLDQMTAVYADLELEFDQVRKERDARTLEMDSLRHEAAAQVAAVQMQAGEAEREYGRLAAGMDATQETNRAVQAGLEDLRRQFMAQADTVAKLVERLNAAPAPARVSGSIPGSLDDSPEAVEAAAFDLDAIIRAQAPFDLQKSPSGL